MDRLDRAGGWSQPAGRQRRWVTHTGHEALTAPHRIVRASRWTEEPPAVSSRLVTLDGSSGEGGGQILRTALSLSLLTGRPFRIVNIRANREKPGLRPQHLKAVQAAAELAGSRAEGASVGSRELTFRPAPYTPRDLALDIGTAGSTALVLHTLYLPLALRAEQPVRLSLSGGTFNTHAPSFPFLETTWRSYLRALGMPISVAMPSAGFYPRGGGRLEAWIEPAQPLPLTRTERGPLERIVGFAGVAHLNLGIAERMRDQALARLAERGLTAEIRVGTWPGPVPGAAIALTGEHDGLPSTFVGLGERGKLAERVADDAVNELLAFEETGGAVDLHSADQILLPLALASGPSEYTVGEVTDHLRTNIATVQAFLDRSISVIEPNEGSGRVMID